MKIKELQQWVDNDWKNNNASMPDVTLQLLFIMEELGEVAEAIRKNQIKQDRVEKATRTVDLGSELADLMISITTLANHFGVDLTKEIYQFQKRIETRRQKTIPR
ncbi:MAG: MazG nucleotide pyrophosphohydrolase domain-containing protein [Candidatus Saccharimonadales bacterium]